MEMRAGADVADAFAARGEAALQEQNVRVFRAFEALPLSPRFDLNEPSAMPPYDAIGVGSDEVCNISQPYFSSLIWPEFDGAGARAGKLISYAASFGNWDGADGLHKYWANHLRHFDSIAVRDFNSYATSIRARLLKTGARMELDSFGN